MFVLACGEDTTIGGDDLGSEQVIACEAILAAQMTDTAAQGKAGNARGRNEAARRRTGVGGCLIGQVQRCTSASASGSTQIPFIGPRSMTRPSSQVLEPATL